MPHEGGEIGAHEIVNAVAAEKKPPRGRLALRRHAASRADETDELLVERVRIVDGDVELTRTGERKPLGGVAVALVSTVESEGSLAGVNRGSDHGVC